MRRIWIALALTLIAAPVWAQSGNVSKCVSQDPDVSIAGCTALIQEGGLDTAHMAAVSVIRGNAYSDKELYDQAIADYTKALSLEARSRRLQRPWTGLRQAGHRDEAVADFHAALKLDPTDDASLAGLKRLGVDQ